MQLIESGKIDFTKLTAKTYPLEKTHEALAQMAQGDATGKILIEHNVIQTPEP